MVKRKAVYALVGGLLVTGLALNTPAMAKYVQNFEATQTIKAATWDVDFDSQLGEHEIFPGDTISEDTITLTNNNSYPVKYTIKLSAIDNGLKEALTLDVKYGDVNSYINDGEAKEIVVLGKATTTLSSNVIWTPSEEENKDISYKNKSVIYSYDITAEKVDNIIVENNNNKDIQIITVVNEEGIDNVLNIIQEKSDAIIDDIEDKGDYYEYTIRVPKQSSTFDYNTKMYDYIIVRVPKNLDEDGTALGDINRTIFKITSAYRATSDKKLHVHFKLNESLNLSLDSKDNVKVEYLDESGKTLSYKDKYVSGGFLNSNEVKYPKGPNPFEWSKYFNDLKPGECSTTQAANANVNAIKVTVVKDSVKYEETWYLR